MSNTVAPRQALAILGAFDDAGPVTGELVNGAVTDDRTPTLHGTGRPGEVLSVWATYHPIDGHGIWTVVFPLGEVAVQQDGTWKHTLPSVLDNGAYDFHVGNGSEEVAHFTLTLDAPASTLPQLAILDAFDDAGPVTGELVNGAVTDDRTPTLHGTGRPGLAILGAFDDAGPVTGELVNGAVTDDRTPTLHGTGRPGEVLSVWATYHPIDGHGIWTVVFPLGEVAVQQDGTWKHTLPSVLDNGAYDFHVGNGSEEVAHFTLTLDAPASTLPQLAILDAFDDVGPVTGELVNGAVTDDRTPTLHGTGRPGLAILGAFDDAGPVTGELVNGAVTDDRTPTLHGTGRPGEVLSVWATYHPIDGHGIWTVVFPLGEVAVQQDGTWKHTLPSVLDNGAYDFHVGNGSEEVAHFTLTLDAPASTLPQLAILDAFDDVGPWTGELINGSAVTDDHTPTLCNPILSDLLTHSTLTLPFEGDHAVPNVMSSYYKLPASSILDELIMTSQASLIA